MPQSTLIETVVCNHVSEASINHEDEVWMMVQADGGEPVRLPTGRLSTHKLADKSKHGDTSWSIQEEFTYDFCLQVTLYDADIKIRKGSTDYIGTIYITPDQTSPQIASNGESAKYTISFNHS